MRWIHGLALAAFFSLGAAAVACGSDGPAAAGSPVDGGSDDVSSSDVSVPDAGADIEQDPTVYPSKHAPIAQVDNQGGPVMSAPKIVTITFIIPPKIPPAGPPDSGSPDASAEGGTTDAGDDGGTPPADAGEGDAADASPDAAVLGRSDPLRDTLRTFDDTITTTPWWHQALGSYGIGDGTSAGHFEIVLANPSVADADIQGFLATGIANGVLPPPDDETLYLLYFPPSSTVTGPGGSGQSCQQFGGYHYNFSVSVPSGVADVIYGVVAECSSNSNLNTLDYTTSFASHEIAEAVTDPLPADIPLAFSLDTNDPWVPGTPPNLAGEEVGDLCISAPTYTESGYAVQPIYSNSAAAKSMQPCQPQQTPSIYYGAAVATTLQTVKSQDFGNHPSRGYVLVKKGASTTVEVDFFSEAALPNEVLLYSGAKPQWYDPPPAAPSSVDPPPTGIQITLSRTSVHNGNGLWMTVTASSSVSAGDYELIIRSVLNVNDYNDWPFIVEVH